MSDKEIISTWKEELIKFEPEIFERNTLIDAFEEMKFDTDTSQPRIKHKNSIKRNHYLKIFAGWKGFAEDLVNGLLMIALTSYQKSSLNIPNTIQ